MAVIIDSEMEALVRQLGDCTLEQYCAYHEGKREVPSREISVNSGAIDGLERMIVPEKSLLTAVQMFEDSSIKNPAGSWRLVGEQRVWYLAQLASAVPNKNYVRVMIHGVAGATHYNDTISLLESVIPSNALLEVYTIEHCIGPLIEIKHALLQKQGCEYEEKGALISRPYAAIQHKNVMHYLVHDTLEKAILNPETVDIASAHFMLSFDKGNPDTILRQTYEAMHPQGVFLMGSGEKAAMVAEGGIHRYFEQRQFRVGANSTTAWDVYDLTHEQRLNLLAEKDVVVPNNNYLLVLRK